MFCILARCLPWGKQLAEFSIVSPPKKLFDIPILLNMFLLPLLSLCLCAHTDTLWECVECPNGALETDTPVI